MRGFDDGYLWKVAQMSWFIPDILAMMEYLQLNG